MARWKPQALDNNEGLRVRLRERFARLAHRYRSMGGTPWSRIVDAIDAGETVTVSGWQISGVPGVDKHGLYEVDSENGVQTARVERDDR